MISEEIEDGLLQQQQQQRADSRHTTAVISHTRLSPYDPINYFSVFVLLRLGG